MLHGPHFHTQREMWDRHTVSYHTITLCTEPTCRKRKVVPAVLLAYTASLRTLRGRYEPIHNYAQNAFMHCYGEEKCEACESVTVREIAAQDFYIK